MNWIYFLNDANLGHNLVLIMAVWASAVME